MVTEQYSEQAKSRFLEVLKKRGISEQTAALFEMGLLDPQVLVGYYPHPVPEKFFGRHGLIYPIKDLYGTVRSVYLKLPKGSTPKYDSLPFTKNLLFGLDQAYPYILQQRYCILVEGPMDVLTLWSYDVKNVCAVLGTNLKRDQVHLLRRFTNKCYLLFDGDPMGIVTAKEVYRELAQVHMDVTMIELPSGYDPDDYVRQNGKQHLLHLMNHDEG
jgi:DNA primase